MGWRTIHRWLGLTLGALALVLGLSGALLAIDPVHQAWQAPAAAPDLPVATLAERVQAHMPGVEEIRHLPTGRIAALGFDGEQPRADVPPQRRVIPPSLRDEGKRKLLQHIAEQPHNAVGILLAVHPLKLR